MRRYSNVAVDTTLAAGIAAGDTTVPLTSVTGWPTPSGGDVALVVIGSELVAYTGISGNNLTGCTRGADGTTAASHASGAEAKHAGSMRDLGERLGIANTGGRKTSGSSHVVVPGVPLRHATRATVVRDANTLYYMPFLVNQTMSFDLLRLDINVAGTAAARARAGFVKCDFECQPRPAGLVFDSGEFDVSTTGVKDLVVAVTLEPGRYLIALNQNETITYRGRESDYLTGVRGPHEVNTFDSWHAGTVAFGAFADPMPTWSTAFGSGPFKYSVMFSVSAIPEVL